MDYNNLTKEMIDELVAEAERGYDVEWLQTRPVIHASNLDELMEHHRNHTTSSSRKNDSNETLLRYYDC